MRHKVAGRKLGRTSSHRMAMFRNMATSLFQYERIVTTLPKAKELRRVAEKLITTGKKGTEPARRKALSFLRTKAVAHKLLDDLGPRFKEREGGYTRIFKLGPRRGDMAEMALIQLVGSDYKPDNAKASKKKTKK